MRLQFAGIFTLGLLAIIGWAVASPSCHWRKRSVRDGETFTSHGSVNMPKHPFQYLASALEKYAVDDVQVKQEQDRIVDSLTAADLTELARVYREIERRGDALALSRFSRGPRDDEWGLERRRVWLLFCLFHALARRDIEPFASRTVEYQGEVVQLDWSKLPPELQYLAGPAEKYGKYQFMEDVWNFFDRMTPAEYEELLEVERRGKEDWKKIDEFLDRYPMTEHKECALIYFLFLLIDALPRDR